LIAVRLGALAACYLAAARACRTPCGALRSGALATAAFVLCSAPCWWYSLLDPVLLLCFALVPPADPRPAPAGTAWSRAAWAAALLACAVWLWLAWPHVQRLDFDRASVPYLLEGTFPPEQAAGRSSVWAAGPRARIALPRLWPFDGRLRLLLRPAAGAQDQPLQLELNGRPLATLHPRDGWHSYSVPIPAGAMVLGNNSLVLRGRAPRRSGPDQRPLLVALDELVLAAP
jgi:hypothetical protein